MSCRLTQPRVPRGPWWSVLPCPSLARSVINPATGKRKGLPGDGGAGLEGLAPCSSSSQTETRNRFGWSAWLALKVSPPPFVDCGHHAVLLCRLCRRVAWMAKAGRSLPGQAKHARQRTVGEIRLTCWMLRAVPGIAAPLTQKRFSANFLQHSRIIYTFHVDMICVSGMVKPSKAASVPDLKGLRS
jgi:hypothetical protein